MDFRVAVLVGGRPDFEYVRSCSPRPAPVDQSNPALGMEHDLGVIKSADWIIDVDLEAGSGGGQVVAEGSPEHVATATAGHTRQFLAPILGTERG